MISMLPFEKNIREHFFTYLSEGLSAHVKIPELSSNDNMIYPNDSGSVITKAFYNNYDDDTTRGSYNSCRSLFSKAAFKPSTAYAVEIDHDNYEDEPQNRYQKNDGHDLPKLVDAYGKIKFTNDAELAVMMFEETETMSDIERIYVNRFQTINAYVDGVDIELSFKNGIYVEVPANKADISKIRCHMLMKHQTDVIIIDLKKFCDLYT
jgi:hypothetical protein